MEKTLYVTDLDGTFLNSRAEVSPRSSRIISDLTRRGAIISVATARTPATVEPLLHDTLTYPELVVMTGAALWDRPRSAYQAPRYIGDTNLPLLLETTARYGVHPFCYVMRCDTGQLDVYHDPVALNTGEERFVALRRDLSAKTFHLETPLDPTDYTQTSLLFAMGDRDSIVGAGRELQGQTDCIVLYSQDLYFSGLWLLEIFGPGVTKAEGVQRLRRRIGATRVVAFGDHLNDIPMLQQADLAVAVGNAIEQTKAVAHTVIDTNDTDAVARFILEDYSRGM